MNQTLGKQCEGLLAWSRKGEQAITGATAEFGGEQPDGRIAGRDDQGVGGGECKVFSEPAFFKDAVMPDKS